MQKEIELLKKQMEHNHKHAISEMKKLRSDHEKQLKMLQRKTPYDMLPNALTPAQIEKWKKYYEDYNKRQGSCCAFPEEVKIPAGLTPPPAPNMALPSNTPVLSIK